MESVHIWRPISLRIRRNQWYWRLCELPVVTWRYRGQPISQEALAVAERE